MIAALVYARVVVLASAWLIHGSTMGWFDAEHFDPARSRSRTGMPWPLPFGVGTRRFLAATFARQSSAALAHRMPLIRDMRQPGRRSCRWSNSRARH
jgi:cytochrome P450